MKLTPIRALDKRMPDGRRLTIDLVQQEDDSWSYWMHARLDGKVTYDRFQASVNRAAVPPTITMQFEEPLDLPAFPHAMRTVRRPVELTDAEADQIEAAQQEWRERPGRIAREAAPDAPTWVLYNYPVPPPAGMITYDGGKPVMVLGQAGQRWVDDGRSFDLAAEDGCLFHVNVRALTPEERTEWDADRERRARLISALEATRDAFGWYSPWAPKLPADASVVDGPPMETTLMGSGARIRTATGTTLHLGGGRALIRTADALYSDTFGGGAASNGTVHHPLTPARTELFDLLNGAADRGDLPAWLTD
ncbi:hypothetical protein ACFWGI_06755 [Streptomyces niveus]|uniref:hypothetical protein n=1 Tax=Streptomyces niveus TaxID=193462 RepID=UPI00365A894C